MVERHREFAKVTSWAPETEWEKTNPVNIARKALCDGSARISLLGSPTTNLVILDFDDHEEPAVKRVRAEGELLAERRDLDRDYARRWRAGRARPLVERAQALVPATHVERTPRGFHAVWKLSRPVSVYRAAQIGRLIRAQLEELPEGMAVEVFPKLETGGTGTMCSLPLLGTHRVMEPDLETLSFGWKGRRACAEQFLADPGIDPEDFDPHQDRETDIGASEEILAVDRKAHVRSIVSDPVVTARGAPEPLPPHREATEGHLSGSAFVEYALDRFEHGIRRGEHYEAIRKLVACFAYVSSCAEQVRDRLEVFLALPIHGSRHAQRDRKHLMRDVDCQLRHFERGVAAGRCRYDGMRSAAVRRLVARLDETVYSADLAA